MIYPRRKSNKFLLRILTVFFDLKCTIISMPKYIVQITSRNNFYNVDRLILQIVHLTAPASSRANPACIKNTMMANVNKKNASIFSLRPSKSNFPRLLRDMFASEMVRRFCEVYNIKTKFYAVYFLSNHAI